MDSQEVMPRSRTDQLVVQELPFETMVYDLEQHKAHCLNTTATLVWKNCNGRRSVREIRDVVSGDLDVECGDDVVILALAQLQRARLLEGSQFAATSVVQTRRQVLARIAGIGGLAIALPVVTSILAPSAAEASTCLGTDAICTSPAQCCSLNCVIAGSPPLGKCQ